VRSPIDVYLNEIRRCLRWHPLLARRVTTEVADHLAEATAAGMRAGLTPVEAEDEAVQRFGPAALVVQRYRQIGAMPGQLVLAASCATTCAGIWLASVTVLLPVRDASTMMVWRSLAAAFVMYGVLSAACVMDRRDRPVLRRVVGWLSVAALVLGALHVGSTVQSFGSPRHFEGYVLLVGVILFAHGLIAFAYVHRAPSASRGAVLRGPAPLPPPRDP
jgi:hypothetical protein